MRLPSFRSTIAISGAAIVAASVNGQWMINAAINAASPLSTCVTDLLTKAIKPRCNSAASRIMRAMNSDGPR